MFNPPDMSLWQGRVDDEETHSALRWHQVIKPWNGKTDLCNTTALIGFECDEGVRRNKGRPGAKNGPKALREALCNLTVHKDKKLVDIGNVICKEEQLELAQQELSQHVSKALQHNARLIVLGGGHEVAWGSYRGLTNHLAQSDLNKTIGIINFDAHFDLRNPTNGASSGTPFRQIANWCEENKKAFHYFAIGINPSANTEALFEFATQHNVRWRDDVDCTLDQQHDISSEIEDFLSKIDELYLTICLDVFPASIAPGVSAPSALGIPPELVIRLIRDIKLLCEKHNINWQLSDIAELNPSYDHNNQTAKLAARLVYELK